MTVRAASKALLNISVGRDLADGNLVTLDAVVLERDQVALTDPNGLFEVLEREGPRVVPAVLELHEILLRKRVGHMAVVAGSRHAVAGPHPRIMVLPHDVTVYAGLGIVAEIGESLRVTECVEPNP
jgi:hypothetical protein